MPPVWRLNVAKKAGGRCRAGASCPANEEIAKGQIVLEAVTKSGKPLDRFHLHQDCLTGVSPIGIRRPEEVDISRVHESVIPDVIPRIRDWFLSWSDQSHQTIAHPPSSQLREFDSIAQAAGTIAHVVGGHGGSFRKFHFGLPRNALLSEEWKIRHLLATILVSRSHETGVIRYIDNVLHPLTGEGRSVTELAFLAENVHNFDKSHNILPPSGRARDRNVCGLCRLKAHALEHKISHHGQKLDWVVRALWRIVHMHDGKVPQTKAGFRTFHGIGPHMAEVNVNWTGEGGEWPVDTHVDRVCRRLGLVPGAISDAQHSKQVKKTLTHLSKLDVAKVNRSLVDFGQKICRELPVCHKCPFGGDESDRTNSPCKRFRERRLDW